MKCELNTREYKQFVLPDGTISLGNTCQSDKTTKYENVYNMQSEQSCVLLGGTIFLGNTIQRDKTTKSEDIYEMWAEYSWIQTVFLPRWYYLFG